MSNPVSNYHKKGLQTSYVSTIIGISLVLFMIGIVFGGMLSMKSVQKQAKENLQGDLFFKPDLNEADIKQIEQELKTWKEFKEVYFVSSDRAIEEFSGSSNESNEILQIFEGENPLPSTISFKPVEQFANKEGMLKIKNKIISNYSNEVEEVNYDKESVETVNLGFKQFVFLFLIVAILLIIIAVAMINNTIRLALYSKRFTVKTMQLVGATSGFIRKPFLYQSIFQGFVSSVIGMALVMTLYYALNTMLNSIEIPLTLINFLQLFGLILAIGISISLFSTWFALSKYLRMKIDDLY